MWEVLWSSLIYLLASKVGMATFASKKQNVGDSTVVFKSHTTNYTVKSSYIIYLNFFIWI